MKRITILSIAVVGLLSAALVTGCARQETTKIVFATDATWPPMQFIDENKELVGFDIDLVREIAAAAGFEYEIRNTAWDGIFAGLANNQYDAVISSVTITEERKQIMDFSEPYINAGQVIIVPASVTDVTSLADLAGKPVGAQIGTTGAMAIAEMGTIELRNYDELGLAIEDLVNGRLAAVVCDTPIAADFVLQNEVYRGKLKIVGEPFTNEYYGIAVNKGNTRVLDLINKGLRQVRESGKLAQLEEKWIR